MASLTAVRGKLARRGLATRNEWSISGLEGLSGFAGKCAHRFASGFVSEFMLGDGFSDAAQAFDDADVKRATGTSRAAYDAQVKELIEASAGDAGEKKGKPWWKEVEDSS